VPSLSKAGSAVDGFLKSPFSGLAPWVLLSVFSTPGQFELAVCIALGASLLVMLLIRVRGISIHALDVFGTAFFAALAVVGLLASPGLIRWLELWAGEITDVSLALFVITTLIVRKPFTLPYAKEQAPEEFWGTPLFWRIKLRHLVGVGCGVRVHLHRRFRGHCGAEKRGGFLDRPGAAVGGDLLRGRFHRVLSGLRRRQGVCGDGGDAQRTGTVDDQTGRLAAELHSDRGHLRVVDWRGIRGSRNQHDRRRHRRKHAAEQAHPDS
jgi:hypothetical protein